MSALEIVKSGANLVSDRKVVFSRNLDCGLVDFYGHYSSRDLQMCAWCTPWHVSGGDVVECVLACACDAELAVVGHAGLYTGPQAISGGLAVCHS